MDTSGSRAVTATTKKGQRDALRAAANRARKRIARWHSLAKRLRYDRIWMPVWTEMMRSRMSPKRDARRKIRAALWQEWTRPQFEGGGASSAPFGEPSPLGLLSHRDRYILRRAHALMHVSFPDEPLAEEERVAFQAEDQMLQAAIEASLMEMSPETRGSDRTAETRSLDVAGIQTPGTSRRGGKKKRGGRAP